MKYLTSSTAFNIPHNGILCDWHFTEIIQNNKFNIHPINIIGQKLF